MAVTVGNKVLAGHKRIQIDKNTTVGLLCLCVSVVLHMQEVKNSKLSGQRQMWYSSLIFQCACRQKRNRRFLLYFSDVFSICGVKCWILFYAVTAHCSSVASECGPCPWRKGENVTYCTVHASAFHIFCSVTKSTLTQAIFKKKN